MVAVTLSWIRDPVTSAHKALANSTEGGVGLVLSNAEIPSDLPDATSPTAAPGGWARYVGMVQDIWDPELFVAQSETGSGLLLEDSVVPEGGVAPEDFANRTPIYLVSIPGATKWTRPAPAQPVNASSTQRAKRGRDEMDDGDESVATVINSSNNSSHFSTGSAGPSTAPAISRARPPRPPAAPGPSDATDKRQRPGPSLDPAETPFVGLGLNLPQATPGGTAVLAKVYDNYSRLAIKVNSVVEVIGVLQAPIRNANTEEEQATLDGVFVEEVIARNPAVPRLHAVRVRVLQGWECNPALSSAVSQRGLPGVRSDLSVVLQSMRDLLLKFFASALQGDMLAAEYVLMTLVSRPASRTAAGAVLGKLSLNLILPTESDARNIAGALKALCPSVVHINVNIASLNARELFPRKDYTANRLRAAPLQLPTGALLLADETRMTDGQLAERGVKNLRALEAVSSRCMTIADFQYNSMEHPVECCSIFLSKGGKGLVKTDAIVRVTPKKDAGLVPWTTATADVLMKLRTALAVLVEDGEFMIGDNVSAAVETHFVEARRAGRAKDGHECLTRWLSVARTLARTFGERELSVERWQYAMALEQRRERALHRDK